MFVCVCGCFEITFLNFFNHKPRLRRIFYAGLLSPVSEIDLSELNRVLTIDSIRCRRLAASYFCCRIRFFPGSCEIERKQFQLAEKFPASFRYSENVLV